MMNTTNRVLMNTIAQYVRTVFNMILALYSTRLILSALGSTDYGLYAVIAGIVSMLGFVSRALVVSTQRFLSFHHGSKNSENLRKVFANSLVIHIVVAFLLFIILMFLTSIVINNVLDIPVDRKDAGSIVYMLVAGMISISFVTSPFRALFVARENIIYVSVIEILDAVLKVIAAIILTLISYDKLVFYAVLLLCISVFNLLAFSIYAFVKYEECHIPKKNELDKNYSRQLFGFAGWTLYSTGCVLLRTQGIAVVINRFFGVAMNTSLGIGQQVCGAITSVSQAIANALSPQVIKSEGQGLREKMLKLAGIECKYAFIMLSTVSIPIIFEIDFILRLWLGEVPKYADMFCVLFIVATLCDALTAGLSIANQAIGTIKVYSLIFGTIKIITIPIAILLICISRNPVYVMLAYVVVELISSIARLWFLKDTAGLCIIQFVKSYIIPSFVTLFVSCLSCWFVTNIVDWKYKIVLMYLISFTLIVGVTFALMSDMEKTFVKKFLRRTK